MKNYMFIYHNDTPMEMSPEGMTAWTNWFQTLGEKVVDAGNPFNPKAQAQVKGGNVTMDADSTSGYTIVKAGSFEEAVTVAKTCPLAMAPGCSISVYETMPM